MVSGTDKQFPLLTIAIPTWNRADVLRESLELLLPQISKFSSQIEVIISDNGSEDNTQEVVREYISNFPNLSILYNRNDVNIYFFGNIKICRELSKGDYIWILSDDDFVLDSVIENVIKQLTCSVDLASVYLKNNDKGDTFNIYKQNVDQFISSESYLMALISTVIFYNNKSDDTYLFSKYYDSGFIAFVLLVNSFKWKNSIYILEGKCLKGAVAKPRGYNYFNIFINHMDHAIEHMDFIKIKKSSITSFRKRYLIKFMLPSFIIYKVEGDLKYGDFEMVPLKIVVKWLKEKYSDLFIFWAIVFPVILAPRFMLAKVLKYKLGN